MTFEGILSPAVTLDVR